MRKIFTSLASHPCPHRWAEAIHWLRDHPLPLEKTGGLESLFSSVAAGLSVNQPWRILTEEPLHQTLTVCGQRLVLVKKNGAISWPLFDLSLEHLGSNPYNLPREVCVQVRPIAESALNQMQLKGRFEVSLSPDSGLTVTRWYTVVNEVTEKNQHITVEQLAPEQAQCGDEVGQPQPLLSQLLLVQLLLSLRVHAPLHYQAPSAADEVNTCSLTLEGLEPLVRCYSPHDDTDQARLTIIRKHIRLIRLVKAVEKPTGEHQCLHTEVDVEPNTWVGFDRGPMSIEGVRELLTNAIVLWCEGHEASELWRLLPLRHDVIIEVVHRFREIQPIPMVIGTGNSAALDDWKIACRFVQWDEERQFEALHQAAVEVFGESPPLAELYTSWSMSSKADPSSWLAELSKRGDLKGAALVLWLADLTAIRAEQPLVSSKYIQNPLSLHSATSWLASAQHAANEN